MTMFRLDETEWLYYYQADGNIPHQIQVCSLLKLKFCQTSEAENKLYLELIAKPGQVEKEEVEEKKAVPP